MRLLAALVLAGALASSPVMAEWGTDFNMGTFLGGGGTDAGGYLSFECPDPSSGFDTAGQPFVTLTPMAGVVLSKKSVPSEGIIFWVGDELSFLLPMSLETDGKTLSYDYSAESVQSVRDLVAALRKGSHLAAYAGDKQLIMMTLEGSSKALEFVESCIAL